MVFLVWLEELKTRYKRKQEKKEQQWQKKTTKLNRKRSSWYSVLGCNMSKLKIGFPLYVMRVVY